MLISGDMAQHRQGLEMLLNMLRALVAEMYRPASRLSSEEQSSFQVGAVEMQFPRNRGSFTIQQSIREARCLDQPRTCNRRDMNLLEAAWSNYFKRKGPPGLLGARCCAGLLF